MSTVLDEKKKKKKPYSSITYTTGDPDYNMKMFNKYTSGGYLNGTIEPDPSKVITAATPDGANAVFDGGSAGGDSSAGSGGEGGGMGESLIEAKRYVRRYYLKPIGEFASNKTEILQKLIEYEDQDIIVYTLINLGDVKDINKLTDKDIIYKYLDGILYDKNNLKIMDYDLYVKHEEDRPKININQVSDAKFNDVYADRLTDTTTNESLLENNRQTPEDWALLAEEDFNNQRDDKFKDILSRLNRQLKLVEKDRIEEPYYYEYDKRIADKYQAYVNKYRELKKINRIEKHSEDKINTQMANGKEISSAFSSDNQVKDWLRQHVSRIYFSLPDLVNSNAPNSTIVRLLKTQKNLEKEFPGITKDSEHFMWEQRGTEKVKSYYSYWGISGHTIFDTKYINFPIEIKKLIDSAKNKSSSMGANVNLIVKDDETKIDNIYLVFAILDLFDNDLDFYKKDSLSANEFDQDFPDINAYGEKLHEGKEIDGTCVICGEPIEGYGNNAEPYKEGRCCDSCNIKFVIPSRLDQMRNKED